MFLRLETSLTCTYLILFDGLSASCLGKIFFFDSWTVFPLIFLETQDF